MHKEDAEEHVTPSCADGLQTDNIEISFNCWNIKRCNMARKIKVSQHARFEAPGRIQERCRNDPITCCSRTPGCKDNTSKDTFSRWKICKNLG